MINLKNKNIFDNFDFYRNNQSIKNIEKFYGLRIIDLLMHFPNSINNNNLTSKLTWNHEEKFTSIDVKIIKYEKRFNKRSPLKVIGMNEENQLLNILFFNISEFQMKNILSVNQVYRVSGKINVKNGNFQMIHPTNIFKNKDLHFFDKYEPKYDLSRKGINQKILRKLIKNNINYFISSNLPSEWIIDKFKQKEWKSFKKTLQEIHSPQTISEVSRLEQNRRRLAFDELLSSFLTFYKLKNKFSLKNFNKKVLNSQLSSSIIKEFPFKLTKDQLNALNDIKKDLLSNKKMYRLIQGDVGSGKTIVALLIIADLFRSGYQSVVMVPTEILAKQHLNYFRELLSSLDIKIEILTSKTNQKDKQRIYKELSSNKIHVLIGTHSVYNPLVKFHNLGLIVIDEQHKFGVRQRINLLEKAKTVIHLLCLQRQFLEVCLLLFMVKFQFQILRPNLLEEKYNHFYNKTK